MLKMKPLLLLCITALPLTVAPALAAHPVAVARAEPERKTVQLTLGAEVLDSAAGDTGIPAPGRTYHLSIRLPGGVIPDLAVGSTVTVTLPTIHHNTTLATVKSLAKERVELTLANQIQLLEGQNIRVILPLKPVHLYRVPFQAIYSPRGITTEVFVASADQRARLVPVVPLVFTSGKMIVSATELEDALIVTDGTDGLVSGDTVQIFKKEEKQL